MSQIDYNELFRLSAYFCQFNGSKTINIKMVQHAFRFLYLTNPLVNNAILNATKYVTYFYSIENCKVSEFKKASKLKKSLKKFLETSDQDIITYEYRISSCVGIYLCGLDDVFDNTHKTQFASLGKTDNTKSTKSKSEPIPDDEDTEIDCTEIDCTEIDCTKDEEDDDKEEEEEVKPRKSLRLKLKSANV